jgi:outer membrane protein TolC
MNRSCAALVVLILVTTCAVAGAQTVAPQTSEPQAPPASAPPIPTAPQTPPAPPVVPPERVTFDDAVSRAVQRNPSVTSAAADILRAEGLLRQARAAILPSISVNGTNTTLDDVRGLAGQTSTPQNTFNAYVAVSALLFSPADWARRVQAQDTRRVAEAGATDVKRQVSIATAQAYLAVIAAHRVVESQLRARDTAKAFYDYAADRLNAGAGSKLTALQAQQTLSSDEVLVEVAQLSLYRAQEALGVLVTSDRPLDAVDEPAFEVPDETSTLAIADQQVQQRADIQFGTIQVAAARRVVTDSWKDWMPSVSGIFRPTFQNPGSVITPQNSWTALVQFTMPVFDAGERRGVKMVREAALQQSEAALGGQLRQAKSEVREAYEAVRSTARALDSARAATDQARQVLEITIFSFRAGAATNIDVIDAQRRARDADTAVAVVEDNVRRSRLDLLAALGKFPR